jgi:Tol biopolymer transport system component
MMQGSLVCVYRCLFGACLLCMVAGCTKPSPASRNPVVASIAWSQSGSEILVLTESVKGNIDQALIVSFGRTQQVVAKHRLALSDVQVGAWVPAKAELSLVDFEYNKVPPSRVLKIVSSSGKTIRSRNLPISTATVTAAWSPNGRRLALVSLPSTDKSLVQLLSADLKTSTDWAVPGSVHSVQWHPSDSNRLLLQVHHGKLQVDIQELDIRSGHLKQIAPVKSPAWAYLGDGSIVFTSSGTQGDGAGIWKYDPATKRKTRLTNPRLVRLTSLVDVGWSVPSSKAAVLTKQGISTVDLLTGTARSVWRGANASKPTLSDDGRMLAFVSNDIITAKDLVRDKEAVFSVDRQ